MASKYVMTIASQSLGRAWHHNLEDKLTACASHGFQAIELFMEDLQYVAKSLPESYPPQPAGTTFEDSTEWQEQLLAAADYIRDLCIHLHLDIICLQPFMHYDGLIDRKEHQERIQELHFWIRLANQINTDLIQIPSSFLTPDKCTGDRTTIVTDLREAADIGLSYTPTIRFAYEALAWGTHVDTWTDAWDIVRAVDRPNFGTCLDTFNIAGRIFADPTSPTGLTPTAAQDTRESIARITSDLDINKVFYVEVCDGERLDQPLTSSHPWYNADQPARMTWSRNARLFPFEDNGYLPILDIFDAILDKGFQGYVSFEVFSRTINTNEPRLPEKLAQRGSVSWEKLMHHIEQREQSKTQPRSVNSPTTSSRREAQQVARL